MIVEIHLLGDDADCPLRKIVIDQEAVARGIGSRLWTVGELVDLALATTTAGHTTAEPDRRTRLRVIGGGKSRSQ